MALVQFEPVVYILYLNNFKQSGGGATELGERERESELSRRMSEGHSRQQHVAQSSVRVFSTLSLSVLLTIFQSTPLNHFVVVLMQSEGDLVYSITLAC